MTTTSPAKMIDFADTTSWAVRCLALPDLEGCGFTVDNIERNCIRTKFEGAGWYYTNHGVYVFVPERIEPGKFGMLYWTKPPESVLAGVVNMPIRTVTTGRCAVPVSLATDDVLR